MWRSRPAAAPLTPQPSPPPHCARTDGYLSIYLQLLTYTAPDIDDLELTPLQKEAIWAVLAIAEEPGFHFT